jgi:ABC-type multidrug transport system fused ATPase/permease subunit
VWLGESPDENSAAAHEAADGAARISPRSEKSPPDTPWSYFIRSLHYLKPYRALAVVSVVLLVLGILDALLAPWPLKFLVDNVLNGQPLPPLAEAVLGGIRGGRTGLLIFFVVAGFLFVLVQNGLAVLASYVNTKIELNMTLDFRSHMFQHVEALSMAAHDQKRSGMLIYAINNMCDGVPRLIMAVPPLAQSGLTLIGMFAISLMIDWQLALLSIIVIPPLYYWIGYYVRRIQPRLYEVKGLEGESLSIIHEAISMIRVIVAFGRETHEFRRFRGQGEKAIDARVRLTVRQTLFSLAVNVTTAVGTALVLGIGAYNVLNHRLTVGQLLVVIAYIFAVYKPLEAISTTIGSLQDVLVNLRLAFGIMDTPIDIRDARGAVNLRRASGHVVYRQVGFSYAGRTDTLRDVTFEAKPGYVVAIVGPTGAGKSTLVSLLPRFYDVQSGHIQLDGTDIRKLTLRSLRQQISIVLQEPLLFSGPIADNIRYGRLEASMEDVIDAAKAANAHDFISQLPQGYDTELGERGAKLSGGERQRIAVARAFLKDAPILILDEPTSSIDSKTESVILDALDRLMEGRTTFMIAHRLSTIRRADRILVVEHGRIVEQGAHEELLALDGVYKQLHDLQTKYVRKRQRL